MDAFRYAARKAEGKGMRTSPGSRARGSTGGSISSADLVILERPSSSASGNGMGSQRQARPPRSLLDRQSPEPHSPYLGMFSPMPDVPGTSISAATITESQTIALGSSAVPVVHGLQEDAHAGTTVLTPRSVEKWREIGDGRFEGRYDPERIEDPDLVNPDDFNSPGPVSETTRLLNAVQRLAAISAQEQSTSDGTAGRQISPVQARRRVDPMSEIELADSDDDRRAGGPCIANSRQGSTESAWSHLRKLSIESAESASSAAHPRPASGRRPTNQSGRASISSGLENSTQSARRVSVMLPSPVSPSEKTRLSFGQAARTRRHSLLLSHSTPTSPPQASSTRRSSAISLFARARSAARSLAAKGGASGQQSARSPVRNESDALLTSMPAEFHVSELLQPTAERAAAQAFNTVYFNRVNGQFWLRSKSPGSAVHERPFKVASIEEIREYPYNYARLTLYIKESWFRRTRMELDFATPTGKVEFVDVVVAICKSEGKEVHLSK